MSKNSFTGGNFNNFAALNPDDFIKQEVLAAEQAQREEEAAAAVQVTPAQTVRTMRRAAPKAPTSIKLATADKPEAKFDLKKIDPTNPEHVAFMEKWHADTALTPEGRSRSVEEYADSLRKKYGTEQKKEATETGARSAEAVAKYKEESRKARLAKRGGATAPEENPAEEDEGDPEDLSEEEEIPDEQEEEGNGETTPPAESNKKRDKKEKMVTTVEPGVFKPFDIKKAKLSRKDEIAIENTRELGPIPLNLLQRRLDDALDEKDFNERRRSLLILLVAIENGVIPSLKKKNKSLSEEDAATVKAISEEIQSVLAEAEEKVGEKKKSKNIKDALTRLKEERASGQTEEATPEDNEAPEDNDDSEDDTKDAKPGTQPEPEKKSKNSVAREILSGKLSSQEFVSPAQAFSEPGFIAFCDKVTERFGWDYANEVEAGYADNVKTYYEIFVKTRELTSILKETYKNDIEDKTEGTLQLPKEALDCVDIYVVELACGYNPKGEVDDLLNKCRLYKHGPAVIKKHEEELLKARAIYDGEEVQDHISTNERRAIAKSNLADLVSREKIERKKDNTSTKEKKTIAERFAADQRISRGIVGRVTGSVKRRWDPESYLEDVSDSLSTDRSQLEQDILSLDGILNSATGAITDDELEAQVKEIIGHVSYLGYDKKGYIDMTVFDQEGLPPYEIIRRVKTSLSEAKTGLDTSIEEIQGANGQTIVENEVDKYSKKEQIRVAQELVDRNKDLFGEVKKKDIAKNPQLWIVNAISEMNSKISDSHRLIIQAEGKIEQAEQVSVAVRDAFSLAKTRIFEEVANGADVREAVIKHAREKIEGKGKKGSAKSLQEKRNMISKIDSYIAKTGRNPRESATDMETFSEDELAQMAAEVQAERVELLVEATNKTLDKVKIGTFKFDVLRKMLVDTIEGAKDENGHIIEGSDRETSEEIVRMLRRINEDLREKEASTSKKDPRRAVVSSIIFDLTNSI